MCEATLDPLEERIESFEHEWAIRADIDLRDFLPPPGDPDYAILALELMRIDLECRWRSGEPKPLEQYQDSFSEVLREPEQLSELAFEEYRCRLQAGQDADPVEYHRRFGIPTHDWPVQADGATDQNENETLPTIDALGTESDRLVDSIQLFPKVGDEFHGFQLIQQLGRGSFGTVMLARQADLAGRRVVLKISSSASLEPQHLARLQHTNIVPIYSLHRACGLHVVCMPFFGRTTLADFVRTLRSLDALPRTGQLLVDVVASRRGKPLDLSIDGAAKTSTPLDRLAELSYVDACVNIAVHIAEGLEHAHQRGILHRDIKPANVLLTDDGRPMLLDFNISDEIVVGGKSCLFVGGTLPYMSPEQRRALTTGKTIDQRSDVFSFGVLLYEMLSGSLPAERQRHPTGCEQTGDEGSGETLGLVGPQPRIEAADVREANRRVSPGLAAIVAKCLRPDREQRYQTIGQVREDLGRHLDDRPLKYASDRSISERCGKWCRRHPRIASGTTVTTLAVCLMVVLSALLIVRARQLRHYRALASVESISRQLPELRALFGAKDLDLDQIRDGIRRVRSLAGSMHESGDSVWDTHPLIRTLPDAKRNEVRDAVAELYYLAAVGYERQSRLVPLGEQQLEEARSLNRAALSLYAGIDVPAALRSQQSSLREDNAGGEVHSIPSDRLAWRSSPRRAMHVQELIRLGQYARAAEELELLREAEPLDFSSWFLLGNAYVATHRLSEAEGCFTTCVALWPDSYLARFHRGLCRFEMRQFKLAEDDFDEVLRLRKQLMAALFNRALCRKAQKNYPGALSDLDDVHRLQGDRPRVLLVRARVHDLLGNEALAQQDRATALRSPPIDARGWMARALARVEQDPKAALDDLRQAQRIAPGQSAVYRNIAFVLAEHLRRTEEAAELLSNLINEYGNPEDVMAHGVMLARLGRRDQAVREGLSALQRQRDAKLAFQMACVYALNSDRYADDVPVAVGLLAEAISGDPKWLARATTDHDLDSLRHHRSYRLMLRAAVDLRRSADTVRHLDPPASDEKQP